MTRRYGFDPESGLPRFGSADSGWLFPCGFKGSNVVAMGTPLSDVEEEDIDDVRVPPWDVNEDIADVGDSLRSIGYVVLRDKLTPSKLLLDTDMCRLLKSVWPRVM